MARASNQRLARSLPDEPLSDGLPAAAQLVPDTDSFVLPLSDLISDANGEVVLFNDSGLRSLAVRTDAATIGEGVVGRHVTVGGEDVSGYRFMRFSNDLKLYYHPELELQVLRDPG